MKTSKKQSKKTKKIHNPTILSDKEYRKLLAESNAAWEAQDRAQEEASKLTLSKALMMPFTLINFAFFKFPLSYSPFLGIFRVVTYLLILNYLQDFAYHPEKVPFATDLQTYSKNLYSIVSFFVFLIVFGGLVVNGFISLLIAGGIHRGLRAPDEMPGKYRNIAEAFEFRDGVLNQLSTTNKMKEMAKIGFATNDTFQNPKTENEKEVAEYVNGQMGMCPTSGKLKFLEDLYSGGKK